MNTVNEGDIVIIRHIIEDGFDMMKQCNVPHDCFPVPMLVTKVNDERILVHWVHPINKGRQNWHFKPRHIVFMELVE